MAKYASNSEAVKIRACYNSIPAQLAKDNKKFQYKVVQKGGSSTIFGASLEWLKQAGVTLECQRVEQGTHPLPVYADFVLQKDDKIYAIEVKKGEHVRSRSLSVFRQKFSPDYAIRFSQKNFGRTEDVISIPLYAAFLI